MRFVVKLKLIVLTLLYSGSLLAANKSFTFAVYLPQSPPYFYVDQSSNQLVGIVTDVLRLYSQRNQLDFNYRFLNRLRAENALYEGSADVSLLSQEWVKHPEQLIFSKPLYRNGEKFYALSPLSDSPDNIKNLKGKIICTREFYTYPLFDKYVATADVKRMDTQSEYHQMKMMLSGRCDFAYLNEWVAAHLINNILATEQTIYASDNAFDTNNGIFAFNRKWQAQLPDFNQFIDELIQSGTLAAIIERYTKSHTARPVN